KVIATNARRGKAAPPISPIALEAVKRIDLLFDIDRDINGLAAAERLAVRTERSAPLVADLESWMRAERAKLSRHAPAAQAIDYMLKRWEGFARFLGDGRICLTNNAAERAPQVVALRRLRARRRPRRGYVHAHRHGQTQRHRSAGMARRRPCPYPAKPPARAAAVELAHHSQRTQSSLTAALTGRLRRNGEILEQNAKCLRPCVFDRAGIR